MTDLRKAAEMLIKALDDGWVERGDSVVIALRQALAQPDPRPEWMKGDPDINKALERANQILAQPEPWDTSDMAYRPNGLSVEQEPVAWMYEQDGDTCFGHPDGYYPSNAVPLYTASPNLKQNTNKVFEKLCAQARRTERGACHQIVWDYGFSRIDNEEVQAACVDLAQAIQARGKNE